MDFKKWLKEEKGSGGFGVLLIVVIIAAAIYAVEVGSSNFLYKPNPTYSEAEFITTEADYSVDDTRDTENLHTTRQPVYENSDLSDATTGDAMVVEREDDTEPENKAGIITKTKSNNIVAPAEKNKLKPPVKPKKYRLSNEDLVKRKLKQGKTVRQIADETGLNKKYIREVKRRTQQVIW